MKNKFELRSILLAFLPWLHVALIIAPIYAYVASYVWEKDILPSYFMGLSIIFPTAVTRLLITRTKNLFVYLLLSVLMAALWFYFDPILGVVLLFMVVIRLAGRFRSGNKTVFDRLHYAGTAAFLLAFVFSAASNLPDLQFISLVSALVYGMLTLFFRSLTRLDEYIEMNRGMADFPVKRVSSTTLKTVSSLVAALLSICLVILVVSFDFYFFPEFSNPGAELGSWLFVDPNAVAAPVAPQINMPGFAANPLNINWQAVGKVLVSFVAAVIIIALAVVIYNLAKSFAETSVIREENDIIEQIKDREEKLPTQKKKPRLVPDLSPNGAIRKKYRKAVLAGDYSPQPWQSPAEIEKNAGIQNETLHELYEKARYSETGCSADDKKRL